MTDLELHLQPLNKLDLHNLVGELTADGTVLRLAATAPVGTIRSAIAAIAGVRDIAVEPDPDSTTNRYLIRAEPRPSLAADIVAALVRAGIGVSELTEARPDLERVFLDLTRPSSRTAA